MSVAERRLSAIRRVVIWGHPLHSHTHSYVHEAFARGFRALGADTIWTDDRRALSELDLADTLFLSEGQVIEGLPLRRDCLYVLHNVDRRHYEEIADRVLALQVLTTDARHARADGSRPERVNEFTFVERSNGVTCLSQPWATDLLPDEFDLDVRFPTPWPQSRIRSAIRHVRTGRFKAAWVGTIGSGQYGNDDELAPFRAACEAARVDFVAKAGIGRKDHIDFVQSSLLAPAIVGRWQLEHAYVPCRIFKNISYGRLGITNSRWVAGIFEEPMLCRSDTAELFWAAMAHVRDESALVAQMREVQARHTYLNRIRTILDYLP